VAATDEGGELGEFMWPDKSLVNERLWAQGSPKVYNENEYTFVAFYPNELSLRNHQFKDRRFYLCEADYELEDCL
jgi:hypothetical protein